MVDERIQYNWGWVQSGSQCQLRIWRGMRGWPSCSRPSSWMERATLRFINLVLVEKMNDLTHFHWRKLSPKFDFLSRSKESRYCILRVLSSLELSLSSFRHRQYLNFEEVCRMMVREHSNFKQASRTLFPLYLLVVLFRWVSVMVVRLLQLCTIIWRHIPQRRNINTFLYKALSLWIPIRSTVNIHRAAL